MTHFSLRDLVNERIDFEIIEDKIWDIYEIEEGDIYYCVDESLHIEETEYCNLYIADIENIAFKKRKYAEEYRERLLKFNEYYKKEARG